MIPVHSKRHIAKHALLIEDLIAAGYRLTDAPGFVDSQGMGVYIEDDEDKQAVQAFIEVWKDPEPTYDVLRLKAYLDAWTHIDFEEAIFEYLQGDRTKLDALLAKRDAIRAQYPKPIE